MPVTPEPDALGPLGSCALPPFLCKRRSPHFPLSCSQQAAKTGAHMLPVLCDRQAGPISRRQLTLKRGDCFVNQGQVFLPMDCAAGQMANIDHPQIGSHLILLCGILFSVSSISLCFMAEFQ